MTDFTHHTPRLLSDADAAADLAGVQRPVSHYTDQVMQIVNDVPMDAVRTQWGVDACEMLRDLVSERDALAGRVRELEADAARYQFIRNGGACIDQDEDGVYMATKRAGKYYTDLRDFDMDIDEAIAALTTPESKP